MRSAAIAVLALFLMAGRAGAAEKTVTATFEDVTLVKAVQKIKEICEVEIEVSTGLARAKVTADLKEVPLAEALAQLAKLAAEDGEAVELDPGYWRLRRKGEDDPPEVKIKRALDGVRVNVNYADTRLEDALGFLSNYADVPIVLDPEVSRTKSEDELLVNLQADDITLGNAVDLIVLTKGLAKEVRWSVLFVSTEERLKDFPEDVLPVVSKAAEDWELDLRKRLAGRIAFAFDGATLLQALDFVKRLKSLNVVVAPEAREAAEAADISMKLSDVPVGDALALMLLPRGFTYRLEKGVVLVVER